MNKKLSTILISLGVLFLINAILGRYIVLPGFLASLEQGKSTVESVSQTVSAWKIIRYLLWGYSFKFGIYFIILGATFRTENVIHPKMGHRYRWIYLYRICLYPPTDASIHRFWDFWRGDDSVDDFCIPSLGNKT